MIPYDMRIKPAAPFLDVVVKNPVGSVRPIVLRAILDTGADMTAVPREALKTLALKSARNIEMEGIGGVIGVIPMFVVTIEVVGKVMAEFYAIEWEGDFVILGRDVLNEFYIILDGPMRQFEMRAM